MHVSRMAHYHWRMAHVMQGWYMPSKDGPVAVAEGLTCNFDVEIGVQQQVLSLEVTVHNMMAVAVAHGRHNLTELTPCLPFIHAPMRHKVICECAHTHKITYI